MYVQQLREQESYKMIILFLGIICYVQITYFEVIKLEWDARCTAVRKIHNTAVRRQYHTPEKYDTSTRYQGTRTKVPGAVPGTYIGGSRPKLPQYCCTGVQLLYRYFLYTCIRGTYPRSTLSSKSEQEQNTHAVISKLYLSYILYMHIGRVTLPRTRYLVSGTGTFVPRCHTCTWYFEVCNYMADLYCYVIQSTAWYRIVFDRIIWLHILIIYLVIWSIYLYM